MSITILTSCATQSEKGFDEIDFSYQVCVDPSEKYLVEDFKAIPFEPAKDLKLGYYRGAIWVKFNVKNHTQEQKVVVIQNNDDFNRNYRFYEFDSTHNNLKRVGKSESLTYEDDRSFNRPNPNFKISLEPNQQKIFYQYITSDGRVVQATPHLISLEDYIENMNKNTIENVLFYGVIFIVFLINFMYLIILKKKVYFYYTCYILSSIFFYAGVEGYFFGLGISNQIIDHFVFVSLYFFLFFFIFFSAYFLNIHSISVRFFKFLMLFSSVFVLLLIFQLVFYTISISYLHFTLNIVACGVMLLVLIMLGISLKKKTIEAKFYIIALSSYLVFMIIGLTNAHIGLLPGDGKMYFKTGFIIELVIFTYTVAAILAIGDKRRIELEQELKDSYKAKEETLQRLHELNDKNDALKSTITDIREGKIEKTDLLAIFKLLESNLSEEADWLSFKEKFEQLNPDFLSNLYKRHPELSKSEIRLLTLVKIGFTQKEIAKILYVAEDSVKKAKQRVRKKITLSTVITLPDYLMDM